jgi:hypothetical protein
MAAGAALPVIGGVNTIARSNRANTKTMSPRNASIVMFCAAGLTPSTPLTVQIACGSPAHFGDGQT